LGEAIRIGTVLIVCGSEHLRLVVSAASSASNEDPEERVGKDEDDDIVTSRLADVQCNKSRMVVGFFTMNETPQC
jgi:hypothetical protein